VLTFSHAVVLGHGLLDLDALPVPLPVLLWTAGAAVLGTAVLLGRRGRSAHPRWAVRPLPPVVTRVVDHAATRVLLRAVGLLGLALVLAAAAFGTDSAATNPAPRLLYAVFWGGLVIASLLLGPVWRRVNPLRALTALLARAAGDPEERGARPLPDTLGYLPAAVALLVFVWAELVLPHRPSLVLLVVAGGLLAQLGLASRYGSAWYERGDPFEVVSDLVGRLSVWGRDDQGRIALVNPRVKLAALAPAGVVSAGARPVVPPGLEAVVSVVVGAAVFENLTELPAWGNLFVTSSAGVRIAAETVLLVACIAVVLAVAAAATRRDALAPALVPLLAAYGFVHHLGVLLIDGQVALAQVSDPFDAGWDVLGTATRPVDIEIISSAVSAVLHLGVFLGLHLLAVVAADDLVAGRLPPRHARAAQTGVRALVTVSAVGGIALLLATSA
jgi:hypothetical protein